jgi:hypothetical protein
MLIQQKLTRLKKGAGPQELTELSPEQKDQIYKIMRLRVLTQRDGTLIADWGCNDVPQPRWSSISTTPAFRFRAVLKGDGSEEIELARA